MMWSGLTFSCHYFCFILIKKYKLEALTQAGNSICKILTQVYSKIHTFPGEGCKNSPMQAVTSLELFPNAPCLTLLKCESPATRK